MVQYTSLNYLLSKPMKFNVIAEPVEEKAKFKYVAEIKVGNFQGRTTIDYLNSL